MTSVKPTGTKISKWCKWAPILSNCIFQVPKCKFVKITSWLSRLKSVCGVPYWSPDVSTLSKCMVVFSHAPGGNGASQCPTAVTPPAVNRRWQMGRWVWNSHDFWNPMCLLVGMAVFLLIILHPKISLCWFILEQIKTITIHVCIHYYYLEKALRYFLLFFHSCLPP